MVRRQCPRCGMYMRALKRRPVLRCPGCGLEDPPTPLPPRPVVVCHHCGYRWAALVKQPKMCPKCKRYLARPPRNRFAPIECRRCGRLLHPRKEVAVERRCSYCGKYMYKRKAAEPI